MMMTVAETFENMQAYFNSSAAAGLNKTIQVDLSGDEGGKWAIKIANQMCELIPGGVDEPDLTLIMSDQNWLAIVERRLDPMNAFVTGKIKATGDLPLAMRVPNLFKWQ
jgi:putative sterol carrier protein